MKRGRKKESKPGVELPIAPMLDMTFQLLAFFIFTYRPTIMEGKLEFQLPASGTFKAQDASMVDPTKPSDVEVNLPSELTVVLKTPKDGDGVGTISQIEVQSREANSVVPTVEALTEYLKRVRQELQNQDDIRIRPDKALKYSFVVEVMDACRKADFNRISFDAPPDLVGN